MPSKVQAEPAGTSLDECHRAVLNIVTELSPCSEPKLFITSINAKPDCFRDRSLSELRELLSQCVLDLQSNGLLRIVDDKFVVADPTDSKDQERADAESSDDVGEPIVDPDLDEDVSWSDLQRTFEDLSDERPKARETQEQHVDAPVGLTDADILELSAELELDVEDEPIDQGHAESKAPSNREPSATPPTNEIARVASGTLATGNAGSTEADQEPVGQVSADGGAMAERGDMERSTEGVEEPSIEIEDTYSVDEDILELVNELNEAEGVTVAEDRAEQDHLGNSDSVADGIDDEPSAEEIIAAIREFMSEKDPKVG